MKYFLLSFILITFLSCESPWCANLRKSIEDGEKYNSKNYDSRTRETLDKAKEEYYSLCGGG